MMSEINTWMIEHPTLFKISKYLVIVITVLLIISWIRRAVRKKLPDSPSKY
jgi:Ca2+/Na+ antiporter